MDSASRSVPLKRRTLAAFAARCDVVTWEFENVPLSAVAATVLAARVGRLGDAARQRGWWFVPVAWAAAVAIALWPTTPEPPVRFTTFTGWPRWGFGSKFA